VATQTELFRQVTLFVARATLWFLRNAPQPIDVTGIIAGYGPGIRTYMECYESIISTSIAKAYQEKIERLTTQQVPPALATLIGRLEILSSACDVVRVSNDSKRPLADVGALYFQLGAVLKLGWLRRQASRMGAQSHWDRLAVHSVIGSLFDEQRRLTASVIAAGTLEGWCKAHTKEIERFTAFIADLKTSDAMTLPKLVIAAKKVEEVGR
jgi:glutamate dehydrogenase